MKRLTFCLITGFSLLFVSCNQQTNNSVESETETQAETEQTMQADYRQIADLNDAIEESKNQEVFLFKHSTACPISAEAKNVMDTFVEENKIPVYLVVVQTDRPMSNKIAENFDIKHESPQLLILDNGEIKAVFNHYEIRRDHILEELESKS